METLFLIFGALAVLVFYVCVIKLLCSLSDYLDRH